MVGSKQVAMCRTVLSRSTKRTNHLISATLVALAICAAAGTAAQQPPATEPEEEYGEFLARPGELGAISVNDIAKSLRLTAGAMSLGKKVYEKHCAMCHGADGKGIPSRHTPDFTAPSWQQTRADSDFLAAVTKGTDSGMPAFGDQLTPAQIDSLVHCMIRGFAQPTGR